MSKFKFKLGSVGRDKITGFTGIIISRSQWLHNCNTYGLKPQVLREGKSLDSEHFDEPAIEIIKDPIFKEKRDTGGPTPSISRTNR